MKPGARETRQHRGAQPRLGEENLAAPLRIDRRGRIALRPAESVDEWDSDSVTLHELASRVLEQFRRLKERGFLED